MTSEVAKDMYFDPRVCVIVARGGAGERGGYVWQALEKAVARAARRLGWSAGTDTCGAIVGRGDRVLIKPNLVMDRNQGPWGLDPLITNPALIFAVAGEVLRSNPSQLLVGDAPLQSCDFDMMLHQSGLINYSEELQGKDSRFKGIVDFRRTTCDFVAGVRVPEEDLRPMDDFVLYDLHNESLLENVTDERHAFRVTCYDPHLMAQTHSRGKHQYLVAREVIESNLIVNMPKLKTHRKAGMTCCLKNLIGINGNKEYLPHHRLGGSQSAGDCYPGNSTIKRALELTLDRTNSASGYATAFVWRQAATHLARVISMGGDRIGVEGAWSGNDTIWRTCLDLNRILLYGLGDGTMADEPQRRVIHVVDAVIAGHGEGPLSPQPLPLGLIIAGYNAAAVDLVGAMLLGFDPRRVPCVMNAFDQFRWPVAAFRPEDIVLTGDLGSSIESVARFRREFQIVYPAGWLDAVEAAGTGSNTRSEGQGH